MLHHRDIDPRFAIATDAAERYARHAGEMIRSRDARCLVAVPETGGELAGYLMGEIQHRPPISVPGTFGFVSDIFVRAPWRRHGAGKALYGEMHRWFTSRKATAVELYVSELNPAASAFWLAMGLTPYMRLLQGPI